MILQFLPSFENQFSQNQEVGNYDNVALNQRSLNTLLATKSYCQKLFERNNLLCLM